MPDPDPLPIPGADTPAGDASQSAPPTPKEETPPGDKKPDGPSAVEQFIRKFHGPEKAPEEPKAEDPPAPPADDDDADINEVPLDRLEADADAAANDPSVPRKLAKKHKKVLGRLKRAEPLADLGADIITTCETHGWDPKDYVRFMRLGARARTGDAAALQELRRELGADEMQTVAQRTWGVEDEKWLGQAIANGDIAAEKADEVRARFQSAPPASAPKPPPVAAPPQPQQQPTAAPEDRAAVERGKTEIRDAFDRHTTGLGEADKTRVRTELLAKLKSYGNRHPDSWGAIADNLTAGIVQRMRAAAAPVKAPSSPPLRPGGSTPATPAPKTAREGFLQKWHS